MDRIPKVIHYCWFGRGRKAKLVKKCIKSWKKYLPDYKIIEWNEDNFDINSNEYVKEAYEAKKYAFVSDYVRFYVLYNYGGLYMDTDVEVIKNLDVFLTDDGFMGFEDELNVAPGLIVGAKKNNKIIKEILDNYRDRKFILEDGNYNLITVVKYTTNILSKYGLVGNNKLQRVSGITIYPKTYFCPLTFNSKKSDFSNNTYTIHHFAASWHSKEDRKKLKRASRYRERKEFLCKFMSERNAYIILDFKWILLNKIKNLKSIIKNSC